MQLELPTILIVDDSKLARRLLVEQLNTLGYKSILEASEGGEALTILHENQKLGRLIGLIITDLRMPEMGGADFLRKLSADPLLKDIPKLISSVETDYATMLNAVSYGAAGYILKPTTVDVLKAKIDKTLHEKKAVT